MLGRCENTYKVFRHLLMISAYSQIPKTISFHPQIPSTRPLPNWSPTSRDRSQLPSPVAGFRVGLSMPTSDRIPKVNVIAAAGGNGCRAVRRGDGETRRSLVALCGGQRLRPGRGTLEEMLPFLSLRVVAQSRRDCFVADCVSSFHRPRTVPLPLGREDTPPVLASFDIIIIITLEAGFTAGISCIDQITLYNNFYRKKRLK